MYKLARLRFDPHDLVHKVHMLYRALSYLAEQWDVLNGLQNQATMNLKPSLSDCRSFCHLLFVIFSSWKKLLWTNLKNFKLDLCYFRFYLIKINIAWALIHIVVCCSFRIWSIPFTIHSFIYLSIYLSTYLSICLSIYRKTYI